MTHPYCNGDGPLLGVPSPWVSVPQPPVDLVPVDLVKDVEINVAAHLSYFEGAMFVALAKEDVCRRQLHSIPSFFSPLTDAFQFVEREIARCQEIGAAGAIGCQHDMSIASWTTLAGFMTAIADRAETSLPGSILACALRIFVSATEKENARRKQGNRTRVCESCERPTVEHPALRSIRTLLRDAISTPCVMQAPKAESCSGPSVSKKPAKKPAKKNAPDERSHPRYPKNSG